MRKVALAVVLILAVSEMSGVTVLATSTTQAEPGAGVRPGRARRKVRVNDAALARRVQDKGGELLADYGSYRLLAVESAAATALLRERGVEARDQDDQILLNARTIDTATDEAQTLRTSTTALGERRLHLVQFVGPVRPAWYAALEKAGARIVSYVPNNAYLVYGDDEALGRIRTLASAARYVQWEGPFRDEYRVHPLAVFDPRRALSVTAGEPALYAVQLVADPQANEATLQAIADARGAVKHRFQALDFENVIAALDAAGVQALAARPDVVSIQPYAMPRKNDESQGQIVAGHLTGGSPTGPGYLAFLSSLGFTQSQFTASAFVVDVTDSGLDNATTSPNHFALYTNGDKAGGASRVVYNRLEGTAHTGSTLQGCDGHGTLNAHIVGGFTDQTGFPHEDASGFNYGLGIAPFVKLGSSVIFDPNTYTFPNFRNLQSRAYRDGARISSNSWGAEVSGLYTVDSQAYDALVRDAQPAGSAVPVAGNQEMVVVFAAGNAGPGATTTISPGTAKNVITVGATEGVRAIGGSDGCGATDLDANVAGDIAYFSSRGPTFDGRNKPDLVAPGTHVTGGVFQTASPGATGQAAACFTASGVCGGLSPNHFFPAGQQFYTASSGTSHATPAVAGGAALVRQFFINEGLVPPSPAMTKAFLMSSARYISGSGAGGNLWSNSQGMGLMDLGAAFDSVDRILRDQLPADTFTASGQTRTISGTITDPGKPLRVTLAWTDAPGSTSSNPYRNDLDLTVQVGGATYRGNVFSGATSVTGGGADFRNNVESVFLPSGTSGSFTVTIAAANINSDGVPGSGGALDQDYSLVVMNGQETPVPNIVAGGTALLAEGCGGGNAAIDPGETVTVSLGLSNTGTADTTTLQATLLPTGGVGGPSGPQSYGVLTAGGPAVSRPFSFTAAGTCGGTLLATLQLQDGSNDLGTVGFAFALGALGPGQTGTFQNLAPISIPVGAATVPYPSTLAVSGLIGPVVKVTATLNGLNHAFPDDVDVLLVGPGGQSVVLMSDAGGPVDAADLTLRFDDSAAASLPDGTGITSGTYRPTNYEGVVDPFPAPAPSGPYGSALSVFNGTNPNGTWRLFVLDDFSSSDGGSLAAGFSLTIDTATPSCCGSAGIKVSPITGLVTTEAGGTATFTIALNSVPTANVTIALGSSDLTEGTVAPAALVFTPANALTPQTATVTGLDDNLLDGNVAYSIVTAPATSADPAYAGLNAADVAVSNVDNEPPDLIFKDGFETGSFSAWSGAATGGGRLTVSAPSALEGSFGMSAVVTDTTPLFVQDVAPKAETRYRVRFLLDPNGIGPLAPATSSTLVIFAAYQTTTALPVVVVLRKTGAQYAIQAYTRLDSGALSATAPVNVTDAPHAIAFAWQRASGAGANDGAFLLAIDGAAVGSLTGLDNDTGAIEAARLGVLGLTPATAGTLYFDGFESRR